MILERVVQSEGVCGHLVRRRVWFGYLYLIDHGARKHDNGVRYGSCAGVRRVKRGKVGEWDKRQEVDARAGAAVDPKEQG